MFVRIVSILIVSSIFLVACNSNPPIIKQEIIEPQVEESVELIEEEPDLADQDDEEDISDMQQFIEFTLTDQQISLHIDQIPILSNFLAQHSNRRAAIEDMQLTQIAEEGLDSLFILSFACSDNGCSYLLLNTETEQSILLADDAQISQMLPSPEQNKLLIIFERYANTQAINKMVIFDLLSWTDSQLATDNPELLPVNKFRWPIYDANWLDDSTVEVEIADIEQPSKDLLKDWYEAEEQLLRTEIITIVE
ncbi:hypothetical protein [Amphibacillus sediminis]|uniref:hypothetical protein n=1 Tax=Amphibacillus sediminis TaxID=360185 RepID=UPI00083562EB|nr:hypothetical protein [Amphibacillus sediminis]